MDPSSRAQARSLGYALLAELLERGVSDETREAAQASDALAAAIGGADDDALAADHERAFGWAAPPLAGFYLDPERLVGGARTDALHALLDAAGYTPDLRHRDVEHLSTALRALAFLSGAESDAREDGHEGAVEKVEGLSRRLLDEHVLRWLPIFVLAVRRTGLPFPAAIASELDALVRSHRDALAGPAPRFDLPEAPALLEDDETGLREIGTYLSAPAHAGFVLTREDVARLGRGLNVPRGFGDRTQLIVNLLRSAARFDALDALLEALEEEAGAQAEGLAGYGDVTAPWRARIDESRALLRALRERAEALP